MAYQLRTGEALGDGVRRICCRQIAKALKASRSQRRDDHSPVHQTRKNLKKARAALRLLEGVVRPKEFACAEKRLRDVARLLSDIRDAEVRFHTVQRLGELLHIESDEILHSAEAFLGLELESFLAAFGDWQNEAERGLSTASAQVETWDLESLGGNHIRWTVQQTYRKARLRLHRAYKKPTNERYHDFRKAAKELMNQLRILRPLHPLLMQQEIAELNIIAKHLGEARDLAIVEERLIEHSPKAKGESDPAAEALSELIALREKVLQRTAAAIGERFFAEKPKAFARRISEYFADWERTKDDQISPVHEIARSVMSLNGR
jgi:CHAD domain-containing protein